MLLTSPLARIAVLLALATLMVALTMIRVTVDGQQGEAAPVGPTVSLAGHTPGSAAHERHEYRLRVAAAAVVSGR